MVGLNSFGENFKIISKLVSICSDEIKGSGILRNQVFQFGRLCMVGTLSI